MPRKRLPSFFQTFMKYLLQDDSFQHAVAQWYANADMEVCRYLRLHIKIICLMFRIITPFTF